MPFLHISEYGSPTKNMYFADLFGIGTHGKPKNIGARAKAPKQLPSHGDNN